MKKSYLFESTICLSITILVFLLYLVVTTPPTVSSNTWEIPGNGSIDYMMVGSDSTLYTFTDSEINAIYSNGSLKWKLEVPPEWKVTNNWSAPLYTYVKPDGSRQKYAPYECFNSYPFMAEDSGHLYVYLLNRSTVDLLNVVRWDSKEYSQLQESYKDNRIVCPAEILAISPQGQLEWEYSTMVPIYKGGFGGFYSWGKISIVPTSLIKASDDRVYYYNDTRLEVLSKDGKLLFCLNNVSGQAATDEKGNIYTVRAVPAAQRIDTRYDLLLLPVDLTIVGEDLTSIFYNPGYQMPSSIVEARDPEGRLLWSLDIEANVTRQCYSKELWATDNTLPIYHNGLLYLPVENGLVALDTNGTALWATQIPDKASAIFGQMPFDSEGNIYMETVDVTGWELNLYAISPRGEISSQPWHYSVPWTDEFWRPVYYYKNLESPWPVTGYDGIIYTIDDDSYRQNVTFDENGISGKLEPISLVATDLKSGTEKWNLTITSEDAVRIMLNSSNAGDAVPYYYEAEDNGSIRLSDGTYATCEVQPHTYTDIQIHPGKDTTYLYFLYTVYEGPAIVNKSRCIYKKGLYALDENGKVLYSYPVKGRLANAIAINNTLYYSTNDGRIGGGGVSLITGIAITAVAYLIFRLFVFGTISRARSRIDQNENRVQMLQYVIDHPGASAVDISRDLKMNSGTIRYHLFVLTMNHKVVTYQDGDKYLRYFKNSGTFTAEERTFLSITRREPIRKTLKILDRKPGLSSQELADELGISNTATHRHISLLLEKGVVDREMGKDKGYVYTIREEYRLHVERLRLHS